jgi:hypothetical protein
MSIENPLGGSGSPGPAGPAGINGAQGFDGFDGEDGLDSLIPGNQGNQGNQGIPGSAGMQGIPGPPGIDAEEAEFPYIIPGPVGPPGLVGGNYAQVNPADTAVLSASVPFLMAGLASGTNFIVPASTGVILVILTAYKLNGSGIGTANYHLNWGTGNGPANGAAEVGTTITSLTGISNVASPSLISLIGIIRGATIGIPVWVDISVGNNGATTAYQDINISLTEYAGAGFAEFLGGVPGIDAEEPEYQYIIPGPKGDTGPAGGAASDISMNKLNPAGDITITPGYAAYISDYYEITLSKFLEVGLGSVFEVG